MATNTTTTSTSHTGNTTAGPFAISFTYVKNTDIDVTVAGVLKTLGTHYTFTSATQITFTSGNEPANGAAIAFRRNTNVSTKAVDFQDGSVLTETDLDTSTNQLINGIQEITDEYGKRDGTQTITGNLVFEGATDDANETTLAITDPTADRTITLPDTTGTVVTTGDTGTVSSTMITNATIVDADINASAAIAGSKLQAASGSNAGSMSASDKTKLDGIEASATADQTDAEIRAAVEAASDSNVFTDADHTKLNGIETSATADQTDAEIKTAYEANSNTNAFTDAEKTKLSGIAANADVTSTKQIGDLSNVNTTGVADGKILKYQSSSGNFIIADDGGGGGASLTNGDKGDITVANAGTVSESFTIDNLAVTGAKIANQTITGGKLAANSVLSVHIDTQNVTTPKIADGNITTVKIADTNVTTAKLADNSVTSANIVDGALVNADVNASAAIAGTKISPDFGSQAISTTNDSVTIGDSIIHSGDTNTKIRFPAADTISFECAGEEVLKINRSSAELLRISGPIDSSTQQEFGIGIAVNDAHTHPAAKITLKEFDTSDSRGHLLFYTRGTNNDVASTERLRIDSDGHLLPGTDSQYNIGSNSVRFANIYGDTLYGDGSNLTGITAGAQGGGGESIFFESENEMNNSYTISTNHNALVAGPLTIASGATLTVNSPSVVTIP